MKNAAELAGVYAMFVVVRAKSNVSDFEAPELFVIHPADSAMPMVGFLSSRSPGNQQASSQRSGMGWPKPDSSKVRTWRSTSVLPKNIWSACRRLPSVSFGEG